MRGNMWMGSRCVAGGLLPFGFFFAIPVGVARMARGGGRGACFLSAHGGLLLTVLNLLHTDIVTWTVA